MDELHNVTHRLICAAAEAIYTLHCFGHSTANHVSYPEYRGIDPVHYQLMQTHGWTPAMVRAMNPMDLRFALWEEMHSWI